jgi:NAD(P)-dependent dehydrogenase (short-subunit alcohol dehydrogenase family)
MNEHEQLRGRVVVVTGGNKGIGRACAFLFAQHGARVVVAARDRAAAEAVCAQIAADARAQAVGGAATALECDVRDPAACDRVIAETLARFGQLDVVFSNAGVVPYTSVLDTTDAVWLDTFATNVHGTFYLCRAALRHMTAPGPDGRPHGGVLVLMASDWAVTGGQNATCYAATKGAIAQMTRSMALDYGRHGVRVNAIAPGDTLVERWREPGESDAAFAQRTAALGSEFPLGRVAQPDEIARGVLFLASDASSYMTGQLLVLDGGNTAGGASTRY